jgi:bile acid:Na+ symporter, BASS family
LSNSLELLVRLSVFAFVLSSMFGMGLNMTIRQVFEPFRSTRLVLSTLLANFVLVPASAYLITRTVTADRSLFIALILLGTASGAPLFPKLVEFARSNVRLAVSLMALQMAVTIAYMPLVLPTFFPAVHANAWSIAKPLLTVVLPPLAAGLILRAYREQVAARLQTVFRVSSNATLALVIFFGLAANFSKVLQDGSVNTIVAGALLVLVSLAFGFILGGPHLDTRGVLALGTSQRNVSVAFLVGIESFREPKLVTTLAILALVASCIQLPAAFTIGTRVRLQGGNSVS